ncbi:tRNA epoxyqueuosine(34) reductase QueG [Prosthecomicrobium sp. N25]
MGSADRLKAFLKAEAARLGFADCRVSAPDAIPEAPARLAAALADGHHATMAWMAETAARRGDPRLLWPDVRSIAVLAMNYGPDEDPLAVLAEPDRGGISVYARHRDYHDVVKGKLKDLATRLGAGARALGVAGDAKVFVDTAPVMEKPLAAAAGLGWQGRHTNLVSRRHGSWLFLGEIFLGFPLAPDPPEADHCGSCRACLDACPTGAFPAPYRLDARRCLSYLTIEHAGPIPREFRAPMGNRIYGCDDCLAVCPWNKFASEAAEMKLRARDDLRRPRLADLAGLDDAGFRALFAGSPVKRIGRDRFLRNVLTAIGNAGDPGLAAVARDRLDDASALVRGAAVWALSRLLPSEAFERLRGERAPAEADPDVRAEWEAGAAPEVASSARRPG